MGIDGEFERDEGVAKGDDILRGSVLILGRCWQKRAGSLQDLLGIDGGGFLIRGSETLNVVGGVDGLAVTYRRRSLLIGWI